MDARVLPSVPVVAIVVAAGSGSRLGGGTPKALREVGGVPLVTRSLKQLAAGGVDAAVVVVPDGAQADFEAALSSAPIPCAMVAGGAERQHSVAGGVAYVAMHEALHRAAVVLVHDAARAFVTAEVVRRVVESVRGGADAVVPVVAVVDTIREIVDDAQHSAPVDRSRLRAVQTPQGFRFSVLQEAHDALADSGVVVTDDAAAAEFVGYHVTLVEGAREAFKVTEPFDLRVAEALLAGDDPA